MCYNFVSERTHIDGCGVIHFTEATRRDHASRRLAYFSRFMPSPFVSIQRWLQTSYSTEMCFRDIRRACRSHHKAESVAKLRGVDDVTPTKRASVRCWRCRVRHDDRMTRLNQPPIAVPAAMHWSRPISCGCERSISARSSPHVPSTTLSLIWYL